MWLLSDCWARGRRVTSAPPSNAQCCGHQLFRCAVGYALAYRSASSFSAAATMTAKIWRAVAGGMPAAAAAASIRLDGLRGTRATLSIGSNVVVRVALCIGRLLDRDQ